MSRRRDRSRVVLLGWYGSDNTGDEAVLRAIVGALRKRGMGDLHALSIDAAKTSSRFKVASSPRSLIDRGTLRALRGARALVLGGGGLIQDRTSVYNLPLYAIYVLLARAFGLTVIGWGLGVEPLDTVLGKALARFICSSCAYFSVRDEGSKRLLVRAGVAPDRISVGADPAFLIEAERGDGAGGAKDVVLFCLRDLPDNRPGLNLHYLLPISLRRRVGLGGGAPSEREEEFAKALARAARLCVAELGAEVRFLKLWPGRDDRATLAVEEAARRLGVPGERMRVLSGEGANPEGVAGAVAEASLLVSMRLHALIFGASAGVPGLGLAYARKVRGLMRLLGAERWVVEVEKRNPPPEEIEMKLRLLWERREEASAAARSGAMRARGRAERDADAIAGVIGRMGDR